jgi:hypothetical protein
MKKIVVAVIAILCVPSATLAGERVGEAALGALSGAVVLGPVGAVAGAVIGYTAGPAIADSWGLRRSESRQSAKLPSKTTSKRVSSAQANPPADPRRGASARDVPMPPVKPSAHPDDAKVPINGLEM